MTDQEQALERALVPAQEYRYFICEQEGYEVVALRDGRATYNFNNDECLHVYHLTEGHIQYYLGSGYWKIA